MQAPVAYLVVPSLAHNKAGHSEHNGRVIAIGEALTSVPGIELALQLPPAAPATAAQVTAVHSARYLAQLTAAVKKVPRVWPTLPLICKAARCSVRWMPRAAPSQRWMPCLTGARAPRSVWRGRPATMP